MGSDGMDRATYTDGQMDGSNM